ncbi:Succinate--CoA ligase (ADP-forming) subunit alpha [Lasiodiplodia theobromae]|uniref:Succinate--CoA ligase (ADP-forming) subunit alpha n=1 Tax=Lasiodiplodia theobromae TaxID=45133 RepID=A0A5N5DN54_9PEZI|nr:Succinate--CoA ligase (ADP-forming) subunit alpha [Lasiodiplodia theobromae]
MLSHRLSSMTSCASTTSRAARLPRSSSLRAPFSTTPSRHSYEDTIQNLKIGRHTRVIFQGFTGRQATANAKESLTWGTNIVGGVKPGSEGEHLGLPVFPSVRAAQEKLKPDATGIYVAAHQAAPAIEEAIEAEIPLIVAVAEHIPLHDILRIHSMLNTQSKSRLVGANAPGIISAIGRCRIGFQPLPCFSPGNVGVVAKSGTLSYETVASLTRAGLGQSLCISMGGDVIAGTNFVDALKVFEHDSDTEGIIVVGEVGGRAEEEAAEWIREYRKRTAKPKPIAALVGGKLAPVDRVMGHAGAWPAPGENLAEVKARLLENAGAVLVDHPAKFGNVMKGLLAESNRNGKIQSSASSAASQRRGYHTSHRPHLPSTTQPFASGKSQRRSLHLNAPQASSLLSEHGIKTTREPNSNEDSRYVSITIDRSTRSPAFVVSPSTHPRDIYARARYIPFDYRAGPTQETLTRALEQLHMDAAPPGAKAATHQLLKTLWTLFHTYEGVSLSTHLAVAADADSLLVYNPDFTFDDAAFRSCKRHAALHAQRDTTPSAIDPSELSAESDGIVYVKLGLSSSSADDPSSYNIGTLVNGAGLAMNTVDALALPPHHGRAANFLDTGGKATSATVKRSFELLLADDRVRVIFVNIFGGLTLCDMIAEGILLAFRELGLEEKGIPVVVRLRGTNEAEGQKIVAESGLKVYAYDGFDEAAAKCVELARERS